MHLKGWILNNFKKKVEVKLQNENVQKLLQVLSFLQLYVALCFSFVQSVVQQKCTSTH